MVSPLLSRSLLLQLESLSDEDIKTVLNKALEDERGLAGHDVLEFGSHECWALAWLDVLELDDLLQLAFVLEN